MQGSGVLLRTLLFRVLGSSCARFDELFPGPPVHALLQGSWVILCTLSSLVLGSSCARFYVGFPCLLVSAFMKGCPQLHTCHNGVARSRVLLCNCLELKVQILERFLLARTSRMCFHALKVLVRLIALLWWLNFFTSNCSIFIASICNSSAFIERLYLGRHVFPLCFSPHKNPSFGFSLTEVKPDLKTC